MKQFIQMLKQFVKQFIQMLECLWSCLTVFSVLCEQFELKKCDSQPLHFVPFVALHLAVFKCNNQFSVYISLLFVLLLTHLSSDILSTGSNLSHTGLQPFLLLNAAIWQKWQELSQNGMFWLALWKYQSSGGKKSVFLKLNLNLNKFTFNRANS